MELGGDCIIPPEGWPEKFSFLTKTKQVSSLKRLRSAVNTIYTRWTFSPPTMCILILCLHCWLVFFKVTVWFLRHSYYITLLAHSNVLSTRQFCCFMLQQHSLVFVCKVWQTWLSNVARCLIHTVVKRPSISRICSISRGLYIPVLKLCFNSLFFNVVFVVLLHLHNLDTFKYLEVLLFQYMANN